MTSDDMREAINLIAEYAQTKMLCIDERQKQLLIGLICRFMGGLEQ
jgi:hypothetical protein